MAAELISGRKASMKRTTSESDVYVELDLDGTGSGDISTGVPFYDHMLDALARHSLMNLSVTATGDTHIDVHHTVEDVAITLGQVFQVALEECSGIIDYGEGTIPLHEAVARASARLIVRLYFIPQGETTAKISTLFGGLFSCVMNRNVLESLRYIAAINVYIALLR